MWLHCWTPFSLSLSVETQETTQEMICKMNSESRAVPLAELNSCMNFCRFAPKQYEISKKRIDALRLQLLWSALLKRNESSRGKDLGQAVQINTFSLRAAVSMVAAEVQ